jgi:hypothetical protein
MVTLAQSYDHFTDLLKKMKNGKNKTGINNFTPVWKISSQYSLELKQN